MTDIAIDAIPVERLRSAMECMQQTQHSIATDQHRRGFAWDHPPCLPRTVSQHREAGAYVCESRRQLFPRGL